MTVEATSWTLLEKEFLNAGVEMGFDIIDSNGPQRPGFSAIEYAKKDGTRQDGYRTFLEPYLSRNNLKIATFSYATKVLSSTIDYTFRIRTI